MDHRPGTEPPTMELQMHSIDAGSTISLGLPRAEADMQDVMQATAWQ